MLEMLSLFGCLTVMQCHNVTRPCEFSPSFLSGDSSSVDKSSTHQMSSNDATWCSISVIHKMEQKSKASALCVSLFFSHASLFHFPLHDEWPLLSCSERASVLVCCMYRCLHASTIPFCHPVPRCRNSCSPFTIVAQKNTPRVLIPNIGGSCNLTRMMQSPPPLCWLMLWSCSSSFIFSYRFKNYADFRPTTLLYFFLDSGGSGDAGGPHSHSLSPGADGPGWAGLCEWAPIVSGCSVA